MKRKDLTVEFKRAAVALMVPGVKISALARELGICRQRLYEWREAMAAGDEQLRRPGRPKRTVMPTGASQRSGRSAAARGRAGAPGSGSSSWNSIFSKKPCGESRRCGGRATGLAQLRLRPHPSDDAAARRTDGGADVRVGAGQPGRILPALAGSAPRAAETALRDELQRLALAHRHYGYRRITALLRREGWRVNHKRVLRIMREDNLLCLRKAAFVPATTDSSHRWRIYPNLARRLQPTATNQLWVADITYVRLAEDFAYLAVVLDAFSRRVIGWAMEEHFGPAWRWRLSRWRWRAGPSRRALVHHSDRGVQYACDDYIGLLEAHGIQPSMSRVGCPYDNAMAESFMKTLKHEEVDGRAIAIWRRRAGDRVLPRGGLQSSAPAFGPGLQCSGRNGGKPDPAVERYGALNSRV